MLSCAQFKELLYPSLTDAGGLQVVPPKAPSSSAASETQSEISSVSSDWSDIRSIALKLGVPNPEDLHRDRFKVDRSKLEQMIGTGSLIEGMNGAEYFFESVMKTTETYISWPCRLKIGAKSKKDPHVQIVGRVEDVQRAKERILASLDARGTRVIMKMDVSYTDHSFIIGRGGNNIKRIMEDTQTHIHFPDSNRSNPTEKSNQVSLCGSLEGVERARALVRLSTPVLISFELPILAPGRPQPDRETPYVKMIEAKYNVQVIFSSRPKLHSVLILVKGPEKEAAQVQEATQLLINYSCENIASQILVSMQMEISPQHHEVVKGKNNVNLLSIMERTKTKIIFPDLNDMNVKPLKKSQVHITGTIEGVYLARQQMLGNLPVALIFDFPDNQNDATAIMNLSTKYGVYISLRQKQRQSTLAIVIKGLEKYIDKIYESRLDILGLDGPALRPQVPDACFAHASERELTVAARSALTTLLAGYPDSPKTPNALCAAAAAAAAAAVAVHAHAAAAASAQLHLQSPYGNNSNNNNSLKMHNNNLLMCGGLGGAQAFLAGSLGVGGPGGGGYAGTPPSGGICVPPTHKYLQMHNNSFGRQSQQPSHPLQANHNGSYLKASPLTPAGPGGQAALQQHHQHQHLLQQQQLQQQQQQQSAVPHQSSSSLSATSAMVSPRNSCSNTSGYQSFSSSTTSLEQAYPPYGSGVLGALAPGGGAGSTALGGVAGSGGGNNNNNNISGGMGIPSAAAGNRCHYSPDSTYSSEAGGGGGGHSRLGRRLSDGVLLGLGGGGGGGAGNHGSTPPTSAMLPGSAESYRNLSHYDLKHNRSFDFDMKRSVGFKAMERPPNSGELRTPNTHWMGLALSRTSPGMLESGDVDSAWLRPGTSAGGGGHAVSPYALGVTSGIMDATPTNRRLNLSQHKDIHSLLVSLGLEHYIKIFVLNEIDLEMFTTLTEDNLIELGITAFGARKKILVAIHTLLANEAAIAFAASHGNLNTPVGPSGSGLVSSSSGGAAAGGGGGGGGGGSGRGDSGGSSGSNSSSRFSGSAAPGAERRPSNQW